MAHPWFLLIFPAIALFTLGVVWVFSKLPEPPDIPGDSHWG